MSTVRIAILVAGSRWRGFLINLSIPTLKGSKDS